MSEAKVHPASYRDPAGFVFSVDGVIYRQVNKWYTFRYDYLHHSGLYERLTGQGLMVPYTEGPLSLAQSGDAYKILLPLQVRLISYPSEWCPEQLKDAALLTLKIQRIAMENGMGLKDATPFNIQFLNGQPILIDTLSINLHDREKPWVAYRQFCECFLFPLYIHRYARTGTGKIATAWPDGIPVNETARLLPFKSRWNVGAWLHVFLQSRVTSRKSPIDEQHLKFSKAKLDNLLDHLESTISSLSVTANASSAWSNYYDETILGKDYLAAKQQIFSQYLDTIEFADALDLGCNDGYFSKILAGTGAYVVAVDSDWPCIDRLYREHIPNILPLCIDLANPTPATGFRNAERASFTDRAASDLVIALALIHHLALVNNIPFQLIAGYFGQLAKKYLIVEYVPLSDPKANDLIARKQSPVVDYDPEHFEVAFSRDFHIERKDPIAGSERVLYLMKKRTT